MNKTYIGVKAISLWQPWASLWALGGKLGKHYETRSWEPNPNTLPMPLVIHAAQRWTIKERKFATYTPEVQAALWHYRAHLVSQYDRWRLLKGVEARKMQWGWVAVGNVELPLPLGAFIGAGVLQECLATDRLAITLPELVFGDFSPRRFAWDLRERKRVNYVPAIGRQRFWPCPVDLQEVD